MQKIALSILFACICTNASAIGMDASAQRSNWGGGTLVKCVGDTISGTSACIGESADNDCLPKIYSGTDMGTLMMIARTITKDYAIFCPTQVNGRRNTDNGTVDNYYSVTTGDGENKCVKLYRNYTNMSANASETVCDGQSLFRNNYSDIGIADGTVGNIRDTIPGFEWDKHDKCKNVYGSLQHDIVLGIVDWTLTGHGAFVQPIQVSGVRDDFGKASWADAKAWVRLTPAKDSKRILACKIGYRANADNTNCEPIDPSICITTQADQLGMLCKIYNKNDYKQSQHRLEYDEKNNCYMLRCRQAGYAFDMGGTSECHECVTDWRQGINPETGECVKCGDGELFSKKAVGTGYCAKPKRLSHEDLRYGIGKSSSTSLNEQCWTKHGDEYIKCVNGEK